jgi:hypothetical protein
MELSNQELDKIIDRLQKLETLRERAGTVAEAENAAARIQEHLFKYNLTMAQVSGATRKQKGLQDTAVDLGTKTQWITQWRGSLLSAIAVNNFCRSIYVRGTNESVLIGREENVAVVKGMFTYLLAALQRLQREAYKDVRDWGMTESQSRTWKESFYWGAVGSIHQRLQEQRAADEAKITNDQMALVLVEDSAVEEYFYQRFPHARRGSRRPVNADAYSRGQQAGASINLAKQIGS